MNIGDLVNLKVQTDMSDKLIVWDFRDNNKEVWLFRESSMNSVGWFNCEEVLVGECDE